MITALHALREIMEYTKEKAKELEAEIQEEEEEEEPDYETLYTEALQDKIVRKVMANYRENRAMEENTKAIASGITALIELIAIVLFISGVL